MAEPKRAVTQLILEIYTDGDYNEALTTCFTTLRIVNSTRAIWPIFQLFCAVDNQIIIEKNIYGVNDIEVKIWYTGEKGEKIGEPVTYTLMYLESNLDLPPKIENNVPIDAAKESQRRHVVFTCLAKPAFLAMTQFVNKLWEEESGLRPLDFIYELLDSRGIEYRIFEDGVNEDKVQQLLVPPMTIKSAVDYIHEKFGVFSGPTFRYVNYAGQFLMWDLKMMYEKYKDAPFTKHHKMPTQFDTPGLWDEIQDEAFLKDDVFVTYDMVQALHYANSSLVKYGYDNIYIYHPHEDIMFMQKKNVDEIVEEFGIWHDKPLLKFNEELKNRKLYYYDMKGFEVGSGYTGIYNNFNLTSDMSEAFQDAASVRFTLYRNVKLHLLQKVGEVIYLKPWSKHEFIPGSNYEGGYLVSDTEIVLTREQRGSQEDNMNCIATVTGYRTAQSKD